MTKAIIFSGTHSRHLWLHKEVIECFDNVLAIVMKREEVVPLPPQGLEEIDKNNFIRHFKEREKIENKYYGKLDVQKTFSGATVYETTSLELNSKKTLEIIKKYNADFCFIFGTDLIKEPILSALPLKKINLHLGLSPWYKGGATLFWPFYFLEPQFAGVTIHYINSKPDAGGIIHQKCPELDKNDGIHDVGAKCVVSASIEVKKLCKKISLGHEIKSSEQKTSGRVWQGNDFLPQHLRLIYNLFNNNIVKEFLEGKLSNRKPKLIQHL